MRTHDLELVPAVVDDVDPEAAPVHVDGRRKERVPGPGIFFQVCVTGASEQQEVVLGADGRVEEPTLRCVAQRPRSGLSQRQHGPLSGRVVKREQPC